MVGRRCENPSFTSLAHHLLFHFVLQTEMEQQMVGNLLKVGILALSARHWLFHFVGQNETE